MSAFEQLLTGWDGEQVAVRYEQDLGAWMFIGVHSTVRGPAGGGERSQSQRAVQAASPIHHQSSFTAITMSSPSARRTLTPAVSAAHTVNTAASAASGAHGIWISIDQ